MAELASRVISDKTPWPARPPFLEGQMNRETKDGYGEPQPRPQGRVEVELGVVINDCPI